jgi:hypothetical protein
MIEEFKQRFEPTNAPGTMTTGAVGSFMGKRSAVRNDSGLPVDHSGPALGVGPTPSLTAGRKPEACPSDLDISQCKSGPESEGRALSGTSAASGDLRSEATQQSSYLDPIQINRNRELGRGKYCGRFTVRGQVPNSSETRFHRVNCKCWACSYCGPRRANRYKHAIRATAEARGLQRFLTLTLDPAKIDGDPVRYLNRIFGMFRMSLKRRFRAAPQYIRILEFQKNGNPHFHILIDRYIERDWIQASWEAVGGGRMVDIRYVDVHRVSRYLSKYLTKELLLSAPLRSRRVTTSRGLHLFEKVAQETVWTLIRIPIPRLFEVYAASVTAASFDADEVLESFTANFECE